MKTILKNKKRYRFSHKKRNIFIFLVFVLFLGIGYSTLGTDLGINGSINLEKYKEPIIRTTYSNDATAFRSNTYRDKIKIINLDDEINPPNSVVASWDIGAAGNGNVMAYITTNQDDNTMYDLYIQGDGHLYANEDSKYLFANLRGVDQINGLDNIDLSRVTNMESMFNYTGYNSTSFTLDLGNNFDTSSVTDMSWMFFNTGYANNNFTLDLSIFDFSNITSYTNVFFGWKTTQKIYVKYANDQNWIITNSGNSNLTTSNVLIKT